MKQDNTAAKREREKRTVSLMIRTYCRGRHGTRQGLCPECQALQEYALLRADLCPFIETKTFCSNCRAISPPCGKRSVLLCGIPDRVCCSATRYWSFGTV